MNFIKSFFSYKINLFGVLFLLCFTFTAGYMSRCISTVDSNPIITQYIDGKYGEKFYGVEIYAIKNEELYDVYCKILIGPQTGFMKYYQDVGIIGSEDGIRNITKNYSDIKVSEIDGERILFIGENKILSMTTLEKHR